MSEPEARAFRLELERDDALRLELEEVSGTREMLAGWQVTEPTPSFVFLGNETKSAPRTSLWGRILDVIRGGGPASFGLGLATAGAVVLAIGLTGFRVERVDGGLAFRVGDDDRPAGASTQPAAGPPTFELRPSGPVETASAESRPAGGNPNAYVTRAEVEDIAGQMVGSVVDLLNQHGDRQNREFTGVLQAMYEDISDRQWRDSEELRQHMNSIGLELLLRQTRAGAESSSGSLTPASIEPSDLAPRVRPLEWKEEWR
jgi:hypothetical protein